MTHTPGPWEVYPYEEKRGKLRYAVRSADKSITGWGNVTQLEPDANLIAEAPALLAGMERAEQTIRNLVRCGALSGDYVEIAENEAENLRADIAKAKGEQ